MNQLAIVIPSRNKSNLAACMRSIRGNGETGTVIVVDDFDPLFTRADAEECGIGLWKDVVLTGIDPFVFARNVNLGIRAAGDDDVLLLNDDAMLQTPQGFSLLQRAAEERPEFGLIASTCNNVGNTNQHEHGTFRLREEPRMVCFVAVLIPRRTINQVGLLDERFVGYGYDDDDYCLRVRKAGLKLGIHDGCYVDHAILPSTYRSAGHPGLSVGLDIFKQKWGMDNWGNPA